MKRFVVCCLLLLWSVEARAFSFDDVIAEAQKLSAGTYIENTTPLPEKLIQMDYDAYRSIRYMRDKGPWYDQNLPFEIQFFHMGSLFKHPVKVYEIDQENVRPLNYDSLAFRLGDEALYPFKDLGYAGFRLHYPLNTPDYLDELVVFLGASYFRGLGKHQKYGASARGLAVDTGLITGEEFPEFTTFWLQKPKPGDKQIELYALLNSPRITGAYNFVIKPGYTTRMDVKAVLFPRAPIEKVGIAPLTSMYLFGENTKNRFFDHRMEVHDSDGLLIHNGNDEWLWRPLDNNLKMRISSFEDKNVKGFGLMQRDRDPEHYMDFEAYYEDRPSVWVEPVKPFGPGVVQLIELPSDKEIHDNVVAMFVPEKPLQPGKRYEYDYKLRWMKDRNPIASGFGEVIATYTGLGGVSGVNEKDWTKFVIDFKGKALERIKDVSELTPEVSVQHGRVKDIVVSKNPLTGGYRLVFDFQPKEDIAEIRAVLKKGRWNQTEVWSYQWLE